MQQNRLFGNTPFQKGMILKSELGYINNCLRKRLRKQLKIRSLNKVCLKPDFVGKCKQIINS